MKVDDVLLERLEKLSMIKIDESKKESFKEELSGIIKYMDTLQEVDTSKINIEHSSATPMRDDCVVASDVRDIVLNNAPNAQDGYFIVPKIIG